MYLIDVTQTLPAQLERVFEAVSDHETLLSRGDAMCRVVRDGAEERNGRGALREIRNGAIVFHEAITEFDRPHGYTYIIRSLRGPFGLPLPVHHERGWLELSVSDEGTVVRWRSEFAVTLPLIGPWLERLIGPTFAVAFTQILKGVAQDLAHAGAA